MAIAQAINHSPPIKLPDRILAGGLLTCATLRRIEQIVRPGRVLVIERGSIERVSMQMAVMLKDHHELVNYGMLKWLVISGAYASRHRRR